MDESSPDAMHVVALNGTVIAYVGNLHHEMTPAAAEETSRRLASVAALARMDAVARDGIAQRARGVGAADVDLGSGHACLP